jgi:dTMP kinase
MSVPGTAAHGRFITLEGVEGVGKSTQVEAVARACEAAGHVVVRTREPGGTELAQGIRRLLLDPGGDGPLPETELLLMFAARAEHVGRVIRPALAAGQWVVCDRFTDATYAYQGGGRGQSPEWIAELEGRVHGDLRPDRTLLLDAPVEQGLERARGRGAADRFERETTAFFERARAVYHERAAAEPERFRMIDASGTPETVGEAVRAAVADLA